MEPIRKEELFTMMPTEERRYTIKDIDALPEGQRAELIDGKMYMMASPTLNHQNILVWLNAAIFNHIREHKGKCRVVTAPFGVFIKKDDKNFFEPDINVICDRDKLDQKGCHGAPDWVIEIVSPSSRRMDYRLKLPVYRETGVREYWIVDHDRNKISVYNLQETESPQEYSFADTINSVVLEGLAIDFPELIEYLIQ